MDDKLKALLEQQTSDRFCREEERLDRELQREVGSFNQRAASVGAYESGHRIGKVTEMLVEHEVERTARFVRTHLAICEEAGVPFDEERAEWLKAQVGSMVDHRGNNIRRQVGDDLARRGDLDSRLHEYLNGVIERGLGRAKADAARDVALALGSSQLADRKAEGETLSAARKDADSLTGFLTRKACDLLLAGLVQECIGQDRPACLVMIDLDKFKSTNDTLGHAQGDEILRETGWLVRKVIGLRGIVGRYGGDEFEVILPDFTVEEARVVAERLRVSLSNHVFRRVDGATPGLKLTMTLGIAGLPEHGTTVEGLRERADRALYDAKAAGRNCVRVASAENVAGELAPQDGLKG